MFGFNEKGPEAAKDEPQDRPLKDMNEAEIQAEIQEIEATFHPERDSDPKDLEQVRKLKNELTARATDRMSREA